MRVAIITDTHYGCRKGSKLFQDYFEQFYKNVFFPTLEKEEITTVLHLGDAFDSRKSIDYQSLEWTKRVVLDPLLKYDVHMLVGNHDAYYKNTNSIKLLINNEFSPNKFNISTENSNNNYDNNSQEDKDKLINERISKYCRLYI